jgi:sporulation protein YlmC with PRC-barrel domain
MRTSLLLLTLLTVILWGPAHAQSTPPAASAPQFIKIGENALLSSRLIGLNVQNANGEGIGKIEDLALEGGELVGVVLSVGAIVGDGQHYVAVDPSSISIKYTEGENTWKATLNANADQLKAAPEFRYEGKWKR